MNTETAIANVSRLGLFFDTETTGLPLFNEPSEDPRQPHLVQLAAVLVNLDTRETLESMDVLIKPDGWVSEEKAFEAHGITAERALAEGIPEADAVKQFLAMWSYRLRIAHNETFDARIMRIALKRYIDPLDTSLAIAPSDEWKASAAECTQKLSTPILNLPPTEKMVRARFNKPKPPKLAEAYKHFTGHELVGAHNAMADVQACMVVYFAIQDLKAQQKAA